MSKLEDELATMSPVELAKHIVTRGGQSSEALTAMLQAKLGMEATETQRRTTGELTRATDRLARYTKILAVIGVAQISRWPPQSSPTARPCRLAKVSSGRGRLRRLPLEKRPRLPVARWWA